MPEVHYIKICTPVFREIKSGDSKLELKNDREYKIGDTLILDDINPISQKPTGAWAPKSVIDINYVKEGILTLSLEDICVDIKKHTRKK